MCLCLVVPVLFTCWTAAGRTVEPPIKHILNKGHLSIEDPHFPGSQVLTVLYC